MKYLDVTNLFYFSLGFPDGLASWLRRWMNDLVPGLPLTSILLLLLPQLLLLLLPAALVAAAFRLVWVAGMRFEIAEGLVLGVVQVVVVGG